MHIFAVWNIDCAFDVTFCVVSSGANVNELVSRIADEFFSVSNGDVTFFVGLFFSNFFVVAFDCCFDVSIYSVGTCFESISAGGQLIFVAVNFGDAVVPAAGNVFRLFACQIQQHHGLRSGLTGVAVNVNGFVVWNFIQSFYDVNTVRNVDRGTNMTFVVVSFVTDVDDHAVFWSFCISKESCCGNVVFVSWQICEVVFYFFVEEFLRAAFFHWQLSRFPTVGAAGQGVGFITQHSQDCGSLGSSLTGVALNQNLFVFWQFGEGSAHAFAEWDVFVNAGDPFFQMVVFRTYIQ